MKWADLWVILFREQLVKLMQPIKKSPEKKENDKAVENCNILVYIRVRPTLPKEYEKEIAVKVTEDVRNQWFIQD